jgi:(E)-4-hydroxy-3-methylbut-2-enyl-diphosphate synthase
MSYCAEPYGYQRRRTREVHVGDVALGGARPIRVQSMTTPATTDVQGTVDQMERLADAGCEIVRVTVPTVTDAESLPLIRQEMRRRKIGMPVVADIHFSPAAAMASIEHVEKVRVNPGNYADSRRFEKREYTDVEYAEEIERIGDRFRPLVERAREMGTVIRVGTNHGSLSDRIVNRYGDSPVGMVESALEFLRIAREADFHDLVLSMKSSNPVVMVQAYRLLAARMAEEAMDYPFHLGVTEAGEGEDGRVKSAVGIGALLQDGIGDTIRVSLTEDPVQEIHVARALLATHVGRPLPRTEAWSDVPEVRDPYRYVRRAASLVNVGEIPWGGTEPPRVEVSLGLLDAARVAVLLEQARMVAGPAVAEERRPDLLGMEVVSRPAAGLIRETVAGLGDAAPARLAVRLDAVGPLQPSDLAGSQAHRLDVKLAPGADGTRWLSAAASEGIPVLWEISVPSPSDLAPAVETAVGHAASSSAAGVPSILALRVEPGVPWVGAHRLLVARLAQERIDAPLLLLDRPEALEGPLPLGSASRLGVLLCDGIGDAVRLEGLEPTDAARFSFTLLQGTRLRMSRTEFISCPSCGRTLFDLESTTQRIKSKTGHLKGVKIAIMGCIVNGPGEMADADFGYVGGAPGKVNLFVGMEMVARHVPASEADERLIELIKAHGKWVDPPQSETTTRAGTAAP